MSFFPTFKSEPIFTAEIRWFSAEQTILHNAFAQLPGKSFEILEDMREDVYLNSKIESCGIKVREGRHEMKVKAQNDQICDFGVVEFWVKWSMGVDKSILDCTGSNMRQAWIAVQKTRRKKMYTMSTPMRPIHSAAIHKGCSAEFTVIDIPKLEKKYFTFALEAKSKKRKELDYIMAFIAYTHLETQSLGECRSMGYPKFLMEEC